MPRTCEEPRGWRLRCRQRGSTRASWPKSPLRTSANTNRIIVWKNNSPPSAWIFRGATSRRQLLRCHPATLPQPSPLPTGNNEEPQLDPDTTTIIASLVRRPGAFTLYLYREELFPGRPSGRPSTGSRPWRSAKPMRANCVYSNSPRVPARIASPTALGPSCGRANGRSPT